jgi:peroxiredoxin
VPAPTFRLRSSPYATIALGDLRGRAVILAFYPEDWSPVCSGQMVGLQEFLPAIRALGAELLGISVDGIWSHQAFRRAFMLDFPLLSDSRPRGFVARAYGVLDDQNDCADRAIFVIDPQGIIIWRASYPRDIDPGVHGLLTALEALRRPNTVPARSSLADGRRSAG